MRRHHAIRCGWLLLVLALVPVIARAQEGPLYRWTGTAWERVAGSGRRIAVAPDGSAWVVNTAGEIYHSVGDRFERMPGTAVDVAVGREGSVWIIGTDAGIYRWMGNLWQRVEGSGAAITVDRVGEPWIVNASGDVYHRVTGKFVKLEGAARDIGADNDVWIVAADGGVQQFTRSGRWSASQGSAVRISVSGRGPWIVTDTNAIYRWENGGFRQVPGGATDIGVNSRGDAWVIGIPEAPSAPPPDPTQPSRARRRNPR